MKQTITTCPLCSNSECSIISNINKNDYFDCQSCGLVFIDKEKLPSKKTETDEYLLHNNNYEDIGYQNHLKKLINPLIPYLNKSHQGLDFGCGHTPVLSMIMNDLGFSINNYDPFFFNDKVLIEKEYDFITCSEVIEHFFNPLNDFKILNKILKKGGVLAVMTKPFLDNINFDSWYYVKEISHVSFYRIKTLNWLALNFSWKLKFVNNDVILFFK